MMFFRISMYVWARYWRDVFDGLAEALDPFDPFDNEDDSDGRAG